MHTTKKIIQILKSDYPLDHTELHHSSPLELLIATILSAQSTDAQVNKITQQLFKKYRRPKDYLNIPDKELEKDIFSSGFYKNKARNIRACMAALIHNHNGQVPQTMRELVRLPGVGRKTANIVLSHAFHKHEGIAVDTHVKRLSQRIGLTTNTDPNKIEQDLMKTTPKKYWGHINDILVSHGRRICRAKDPLCRQCKINNLCDSAFAFPKYTSKPQNKK